MALFNTDFEKSKLCNIIASSVNLLFRLFKLFQCIQWGKRGEQSKIINKLAVGLRNRKLIDFYVYASHFEGPKKVMKTRIIANLYHEDKMEPHCLRKMYEIFQFQFCY